MAERRRCTGPWCRTEHGFHYFGNADHKQVDAVLVIGERPYLNLHSSEGKWLGSIDGLPALRRLASAIRKLEPKRPKKRRRGSSGR